MDEEKEFGGGTRKISKHLSFCLEVGERTGKDWVQDEEN